MLLSSRVLEAYLGGGGGGMVMDEIDTCIMKQFCENTHSYSQNLAKFRYFLPSHLFTFYLLVQLLLPALKLNGVSQSISLLSVPWVLAEFYFNRGL